MALTKLGQKRIVNVETDTTEEAKVCRVWYEPTLKELLRSHEWNFAIDRALLNQHVSAPITDDYDYQYELPNDCVRVLDMPDNPLAPYVIEGNLLLTNEDEVKIRYIKKIVDTQLYDSSFVIALADLLALKLCDKIKTSATNKETLRRDYKDSLLNAKFADAIERETPESENTDWVDAGRS